MWRGTLPFILFGLILGCCLYGVVPFINLFRHFRTKVRIQYMSECVALNFKNMGGGGIKIVVA